MEVIKVVERGEQGIKGDPGTEFGEPFEFHYIQATPASVWVVTHNMNGYPNVTVIDSGGSQVEGELVYNSVNQLTLTFTGAFSGNAYLS